MALSELTTFILDNNPYFDRAYDDVYQDETVGIVHDNNQPIFPADNLGNYFYLRLPNNIRFDNASQFNLSECLDTPGLVYDIILVAILNNANADVLLHNLLSTLAAFGGNINLTGASTQRAVIIGQELASMSVEMRDKALQNINSTLVSVYFTYTPAFLPTKLSCITNPCASC